MGHIRISNLQRISQEWGITCTTSNPGHPSVNGKVESAVNTAKSLIQKAVSDGQDTWLAILAYRNMLTVGMTISPVQGLMVHRTRMQLPTATQLFKDGT